MTGPEHYQLGEESIAAANGIAADIKGGLDTMNKATLEVSVALFNTTVALAQAHFTAALVDATAQVDRMAWARVLT